MQNNFLAFTFKYHSFICGAVISVNKIRRNTGESRVKVEGIRRKVQEEDSA
jgi:hypothetical protein